jgi:hypothetical protein
MTRYTIRTYNNVGKFWIIYHQTFDAMDAYSTHSRLIKLGIKAVIDKEPVNH